MRPFFTFYGGKWRAAPHYPPPTYGTIIEPFAGSAGYSMRYPDRQVVLVEKDPLIAETWRYLLHATPSEILTLPDIGPAQSVDDLDVSDGAKLLIGWWLNRGAQRSCKTLSAWGRSGKFPLQFWGAAVRARIASQVDTVRHWNLIEGDYTLSPDIEATWFIDPPYRRAGRYYACGSGGIDYAALAAWCRSRRGQVTVCENVGADWLPFRPWRKCKSNESLHGGKVSHEAIWLQEN